MVTQTVIRFHLGNAAAVTNMVVFKGSLEKNSMFRAEVSQPNP